MYKNLLKIGLFSLLLVFLTVGFVKIFGFKDGDGIYSLTSFYQEQENSIDVINFGSSHVFENVNTGVLWDEYGIASYDLCGSAQPLWNTYYYMKESLKTQNPKVMVVDVYGAMQTENYIDSSRIVKNNLGLKFSKDKINSIKVSAPKEEWTDYILEYPIYHSRYAEIKRSDFEPYLGIPNWEYWKGFGLNTMTTILEMPNIKDVKETKELSEKSEKYLRKIIALSKEKEIPLLLIKTPCYVDVESQKIYNRVSEISEESGVPFINYNLLYDELGLKFDSDFADTSHMNHRGNVKFTRYLAEHLKNNYNIPDRRGDSAYKDYEFMASNWRQLLYNQEFKEIIDIGTYIDYAQNENYITVYCLTGDYESMENYDAVRAKLGTIGIDLNEAQKDTIWVIKNGEILFSSSGITSYNWHLEIGKDDNLMVKYSKGTDTLPRAVINNTEYSVLANGLSVLTYDMFTEEFLENVGFSIFENSLQYGKQPLLVE